MKKIKRLFLGVVASIILCFESPLHATEYTWNASAGAWSESSNWNPSGYPYLSSDSAIFPAIGSANPVTLDINVIVSQFTINNSLGFTLAGDESSMFGLANSLTVTDPGSPTDNTIINPGINITDRSPTINNILSQNVNNKSLILKGPIIGTGTSTLSLNASFGNTIEIDSNNSAQGWNTNIYGGGSVVLGSGASFGSGTFSINESNVANTSSTVIGATTIISICSLEAASSSTITFNNTLTNGGLGSLQIVGSGTVNIAFDNSSSTLDIGLPFGNPTLQLGVDNALPSSTTNINANLGTLDLNGHSQSFTGGILTSAITGTGTITIPSGNLQMSGNHFTRNWNLDINNGATLTLIGTTSLPSTSTSSSTGILYLNGNALTLSSATLDGPLNSSSTGSLTINGGTVSFGSDNYAQNWTTNIINGGKASIKAGADWSSLTTTLDNGTIALASGASPNAHTLNLGSGGGTLQVDDTYSLSWTISGSSSLTKTGVGNLTISGDYSLASWATNINQGSVALGVGGRLPISSITSASGTSFYLNGQTPSFASGAFNGFVNGSGTINKTETGTLEFNNDNHTEPWALTATDGVVKIGVDNALGYGGLNIGASGTLDLNGHTLSVSSGTLVGNIDGSGTITKTSLGTLVLETTYEGGLWEMNITNGTVQVEAENALPGTLITLNPAATLHLNGYSVALTEGSLNGPILGDISSTLYKSGSGTLTVGYDNSGQEWRVNIAQGTLQLDVDNALPSASLSITASQGILDLNGHSQTIKSGDLGGSINGTGTLNKIDGTTILTMSSDHSSELWHMIISEGGVLLNVDNGLPPLISSQSGTTLDLNSHSQVFSIGEFNGTLLGPGTLSKTAPGTLSLGADHHDASWQLNLTSGVVQLGINDAIAPSSVFSLSSGTIDLHGFSQTFKSGTLNGSIQGDATSTLVKEDSTALTIGSDNSGQGWNTTLNGGSLTLSAAAALGSGTLTFNGGTLTTLGDTQVEAVTLSSLGGAFDVALGTTTTVNQKISGVSGTLTKIGSGTLTLNHASSDQSWPTILQDGFLNLAIAAALPLNGSLTLSGGQLNALDHDLTVVLAGTGGTLSLGSANITQNNASMDTLFSGQIVGSGNLIKIGSGKFTLTGSNPSFTGSTYLNEGALEINASSLNGPIKAIGNNCTLTFNQTSDGTWNQPITANQGFVQKIGRGFLDVRANMTLATSLTNQTALSIQEGEFILNATVDVGNNNVFVDAPASLAGNGMLKCNDLRVKGMISPGNSISTLRSSGSVIFEEGSRYYVEFNQDGSCDLLSIAGNVDLSAPNIILQVVPPPGALTTEYYTIIQIKNPPEASDAEGEPNGTITGTFSTIINPLPLISLQMNYTPKSVGFWWNYFPFSSVINGGNAGRVAQYLDSQHPPADSDLDKVILSLKQISDTSKLAEDLDELTPALFNGFNLAFENMTTRLRYLVSDRAYNIFNRNVTCCCPSDNSRGVWIDGIGDWDNQKSIGENIGYHTKSGATLIGFDGELSSCGSLGFFGGYTHTDINWERESSGSSNGTVGGVYGFGSYCGFQIDASLLVTYNRLNSDRHIQTVSTIAANDIDRTAHRRSTDWLWDAHLGIGYPLVFNSFAVTPFAMIDTFENYQGKFHEHGADSINLIVKQQRADMVRGEAGLRFYSCIESCHYFWMPSLSLSAAYEWRPAGRNLHAKMQGAVGYFTAKGLAPNRTLFSPDVELTIIPECTGVSFTLGYNAEVGQRVVNQNGYVRLGYDY